MAENTISQIASAVNENNTINVDFLDETTPVVSSLDVARHFQKKHQHVLRDIDQILSISPKKFNASNFGRVEYTDAKGEKRRAYSLTRDAFSLLAMGFTGAAALRWKLKYIEAFNALEKAALARQAQEALTATQEQAAHAAALVWNLGGKDKRFTRRVAYYRSLGLGVGAIGRVLGLHGRRVSGYLKAAQAMGLVSNTARAEASKEETHA